MNSFPNLTGLFFGASGLLVHLKDGLRNHWLEFGIKFLQLYCAIIVETRLLLFFFVTLYFVLSFFFDFDKMVKRYSAGGGVFLCSLLLMMVYCAASSGLVFLLRLYCRIVGVKSKQ